MQAPNHSCDAQYHMQHDTRCTQLQGRLRNTTLKTLTSPMLQVIQVRLLVSYSAPQQFKCHCGHMMQLIGNGNAKLQLSVSPGGHAPQCAATHCWPPAAQDLLALLCSSHCCCCWPPGSSQPRLEAVMLQQKLVDEREHLCLHAPAHQDVKVTWAATTAGTARCQSLMAAMVCVCV